MSEQVELRPAVVWDCPECGRETFCRCIIPEMAPEDAAALRESKGIADVKGSFIMIPGHVTCPHCDESFKAVHIGVGDVDFS